MNSYAASSKLDIWIVIVTWNNYEDTRECLDSVSKVTYPWYTIVVVDNASEDGTPFHVHQDYPHVTVLENHCNLGFSAGYNVGFRYALQQGADAVFMLNNDTVVDPAALDPLVHAVQQPGVGIAVPIVYHYNAREQVWSAGARYRRFPPAVVMEKRIFDSKEGYHQLEYAIGCSLLITKQTFKHVGLWDENYFFNWEDLDFSLRVRQHNLLIVQVPDAKVWHKISRTTRPETPRFWEAHGASGMIFFRRHYSRSFMKTFFHLVFFVVRELFLKRRWHHVKPFIQGLKVGLFCELRAVPQMDNFRLDSNNISNKV